MPEENSNKSNGALPILQPNDSSGNKGQRKSGRGRTRAAFLIAVHVVIALHIAFFYWYGKALSPVEPSEAMYALDDGQLNAGLIFFGIAILGTAIFGRFFCGWGCHIVALQDLCSMVLRRFGIRPKPLRSRLLIVIPFALAFYMFVWPTVYRIWHGGRHPGFTNHLMTEDFWQTFPGPYIAVLTFAVCGGLIVYLLGNKGFCTYACPYGAAFSIADQVAVGRIRVTDACHQCGQCTAACTSNVQVAAEVKTFGMVVDPGCMKCMDCVSVCPNEALYFGLSNKPSTKSVIEKLVSGNETPRRKKTYDFSITEELFGLLVAAASVYAFRGLYDVLPLLLSTALAAITAFLAIQFFRIFRKRDMRLQSFRLKRAGSITKTGWCMIAVLGIWFAFNAHSFLVQHGRYQGLKYLSRVEISWPELSALAKRDEVTGRFNDAERANIDAGQRSLQRSDRLGFAGVLEVKIGLAYASLMNGDMDSAEEFLRQAYACNPIAGNMLAEFLASRGRADEAYEFLQN